MSVAAVSKPVPEKKPVKFSNLLLGAGLNMYVLQLVERRKRQSTDGIIGSRSQLWVSR
jgi:hypothetical protein